MNWKVCGAGSANPLDECISFAAKKDAAWATGGVSRVINTSPKRQRGNTSSLACASGWSSVLVTLGQDLGHVGEDFFDALVVQLALAEGIVRLDVVGVVKDDGDLGVLIDLVTRRAGRVVDAEHALLDAFLFRHFLGFLLQVLV